MIWPAGVVVTLRGVTPAAGTVIILPVVPTGTVPAPVVNTVPPLALAIGVSGLVARVGETVAPEVMVGVSVAALLVGVAAVPVVAVVPAVPTVPTVPTVEGATVAVVVP